ncbi:MAG: hypothetical protein M9947_18905 [Thermomicrobiales bacterium]|nr:hypothetical protein [Thermomicrobiales bacterium]
MFCCSNGASPVWQDPVASGICANPGWGWDCGGVACPASAGDVQPVALDYVESERVNYAAETEVQVVENVEPEPAVEYVEEVPAEVQYVEEVSAEPQYVEVVEAPVDANADTSVESSAAEPAETPTE